MGSTSPGSPNDECFVLTSSRFRFGVFEVNPRERELRKFGLRVRLQQKPFQILERLLRTPGEFVAREELARLLWPDLHVLFDRSLNTAVNALRRALGDHGRNPRFIETRPGLGYVFIATVEILEPAAANTGHVEHAAERHTEHAPFTSRANHGHRGNVSTGNVAYQEYLKGRYFADKMTEGDIRKSIAYFESALTHDPDHALAYAGLADSWSLFASHGLLSPQMCFGRAKDCAQSALRIDAQLSEVHTAIAAVKQFCDSDWAGAAASFERALALNPNDAAARRHYALHLSALGRFTEASKEIGAALELDPLSLVVNRDAAWILFLSRDFSGAAEQSWKTLAMEPRFAPAQNTLGLAYEQLGMLDEAIVELDNARVCSENHPAAVAALARGFATADRRHEAEELLADLRQASRTRYIAAYWFAIVHAGLGECDLAFQSLQQACDEHDVWLAWLKVDPRFDRLRKYARFEELLRNVGLS
jgi:DNA-binding winged helix-turn-helix (wHTH) protein/tetratricopeptide (TPR) repeat protein